MKRIKRNYKRVVPSEGSFRDSKLFAIVCEGEKREPDYFRMFKYMSRRITVDVIGHDTESGINTTNSAPNWVIERAQHYIEKEGLDKDDDLWIVIDVDRWSFDQLKAVDDYCKLNLNWNLVISDPCFEVWLYFHKKCQIDTNAFGNCSDFKKEIASLSKGGYHPYKFIPDLETAIINAKAADGNKEHFLPEKYSTKVYELGEALMKFISKKDWDTFLEVKLPILIEDSIKRQAYGKTR